MFVCYPDDFNVLTIRLKITERPVTYGLQKQMLVSLGALSAREPVRYKDGEAIRKIHMSTTRQFLIDKT